MKDQINRLIARKQIILLTVGSFEGQQSVQICRVTVLANRDPQIAVVVKRCLDVNRLAQQFSVKRIIVPISARCVIHRGRIEGEGFAKGPLSQHPLDRDQLTISAAKVLVDFFLFNVLAIPLLANLYALVNVVMIQGNVGTQRYWGTNNIGEASRHRKDNLGHFTHNLQMNTIFSHSIKIVLSSLEREK